VCGQTNDVLHYEHWGSEVVHIAGKLFEEGIARVFFVCRSIWPNRRESLARWATDDNGGFFRRKACSFGYGI